MKTPFDLPGWPETRTFGTDVPPGAHLLTASQRFNTIPKEASDFDQTTTINRNSGEVADLSFEFVSFNAVTNTSSLEPLFGAMVETLGDQTISARILVSCAESGERSAAVKLVSRVNVSSRIVRLSREKFTTARDVAPAGKYYPY
jgi:hypothetical protein